MIPRLAKELRPLLLPWSVAALAAGANLAAQANPVFAHGEFGSFLTGLAGVAFVVGVLVLAAMPTAVELHERTLVMLFSQPMRRTQLWKEKMMAATIAIISLGIVHGLASAATGQLTPPLVILYATFAVTAICSVGYHTLATGSILVGIACAAGLPWAIALSVHLFVYYALGFQVDPSERATLALVGGASAVYSAFFLWLSRRQFARCELRDTVATHAAQIPAALIPKTLSELVRSRPTGATANLIRKEVCLQKPIFLVSAVFAVCWLLTLMLMILHPAWHENLVSVFAGLTGTQIVLMVIMIPCVSLGDDKSLGTAAWHLTLPVSARRQWFIKLFVAAATVFAMAVVLPMFLAALTLFKAEVGLLAIQQPEEALGFFIVSTIVFVISFWSASLVNNIVRAALATIVSLIGIGTCALLGGWVGLEYSPGLQTNLGVRIVADESLNPTIVPYSMALVVLVVTIVALLQSLAQFRRTRSSNVIMLKYSLILAAVTFVGAFWYADLIKSSQDQRLLLSPPQPHPQRKP
ncbi:MAG: hypothetical protein EXS35_01240 [Pedosphaera sp.]|nr:hypothetical protein [Pedosphaera sp.]